MAKKSREPKQQRIPGTIDVAREPVVRKAQEYVEALTLRMSTQESENVLRAELIDLMIAEDLREFTLDGHEVKLEHTEKDKITIKKLAEPED